MYPVFEASWEWNKYNFFNIRSLQDAWSPPVNPPWYLLWRPALITREQLGVNTVCLNYYDREGGKMVTGLMSLLASVTILNSGNNDFINKIPGILSNCTNMGDGLVHYRGHYDPCIIRFEDDEHLGILWVSCQPYKHVYNYVRYDTLGNLVLDLRNFKMTQPPVINDLELIELVTPCADYVIDKDTNLWLFYTEGTDVEKKYICWKKYNKKGELLEEKKNSFVAYREIIAIPSTNNKFQLYITPHGWGGPSYRYYNPTLKEPTEVGSPYPNFNVIDLPNDKMLVVSCDVYPPFPLKYFIINEKGKIEKGETIPIDSCAFAKIENHGMVFNIDAFHFSDSILVAVSIWTPYLMNKVNAFYLVKFDNEGNLIKPEKGTKEGKILPAESMPKGVKPSIVMTAYQGLDKLWYYGVDGEGNLYMKKWSRED